MERRGNIWINDKPKTSRPERKPAGQNPKTKTDVEQIMDKIDGGGMNDISGRHRRY